MRQMKISMFRDVSAAWRFRVRYSNGRIMATSEAYSSKAKAMKSAYVLLDAVCNNGISQSVEVEP